ncbi:hypothetical protein GCM10019016_039460 [Streptomyces prasinosporus]|uniref:Response regulatory domain-containing protein n=1 Tax=Streptomyces prasinosporus TaxID=68256 RepID=A0ABP6TPT1_9ACTN
MPALEAGDLVASAELAAPEAETPGGGDLVPGGAERSGGAVPAPAPGSSLQQDQRPSAELEEWPAVEQEPQTARTPRKGIRFGGQKVLIVDDDIRNVFALTSVLEQHGLSVLYAENGREGIEVLEQHDDVAVVLMDIMMPEMDGYATTTAIRRMPQFAGLPIIALTAKAMKGDREKAIESGASDYVTKPVDPGSPADGDGAVDEGGVRPAAAGRGTVAGSVRGRAAWSTRPARRRVEVRDTGNLLVSRSVSATCTVTSR